MRRRVGDIDRAGRPAGSAASHRGRSAVHGVLEGVGQRLLHQPVDGQLEPAVGGEGWPDARGSTRGPWPLSWSISPSSWSNPGHRDSVGPRHGRVPGGAPRAACGCPRVPRPAVAEPSASPLRRVRVLPAAEAGPVGQRDHHREVVGHDVVHLAGDPGPLGRHRHLGLLVPLPFQALRPIHECPDVGPPGRLCTSRNPVPPPTIPVSSTRASRSSNAAPDSRTRRRPALISSKKTAAPAYA